MARSFNPAEPEVIPEAELCDCGKEPFVRKFEGVFYAFCTCELRDASDNYARAIELWNYTKGKGADRE